MHLTRWPVVSLQLDKGGCLPFREIRQEFEMIVPLEDDDGICRKNRYCGENPVHSQYQGLTFL